MRCVKQQSKHERGCFIGIPNTEKRDENTMRSQVFLMKIKGVWIADETLSRVFKISPQSNLNLMSKQRSKVIKIDANQYWASKLPSWL